MSKPSLSSQNLNLLGVALHVLRSSPRD
jgi:hypothetical protein